MLMLLFGLLNCILYNICSILRLQAERTFCTEASVNTSSLSILLPEKLAVWKVPRNTEGSSLSDALMISMHWIIYHSMILLILDHVHQKQSPHHVGPTAVWGRGPADRGC